MQKLSKIALLLLMMQSTSVYAQQKSLISGYVRETGSRELLPGVNIYVPELKTGTVTNNYGFYSLSLPSGTYRITYSFVGYQSVV